MNRTFIGISCNDLPPPPDTLINTQMETDTCANAGGHVHTVLFKALAKH